MFSPTRRPHVTLLFPGRKLVTTPVRGEEVTGSIHCIAAVEALRHRDRQL